MSPVALAAARARQRDVSVADLSGVSEAGAIDRIGDLERLISALQARQLLEVVAYTTRRRRADLADGAPSDQAGRRAATEVAMARRVSTATVQHQISFGHDAVIDHPHLMAAALAGEVSLATLRRVTDETFVLTAEQRWLVDEQLADTVDGDCTITPAQMAKAARRRVLATDPDAAAKREAVARARRSVAFRPLRDGMAAVTGELPAEQAVACWEALDHHARCLRGEGDDRSLNRLMCDTFVERLTGTATTSARRAATGEPAVEVGIVIAASSLLGVDDDPAQLVGYGTISAALARQLATGPSVFARRLVCDPITGELIEADTRKRLFDGPLRTFIAAADQTCRRPGCESPIREFDHLEDHATGGPTNGANGTGYCRPDHTTKHTPGWQVQRSPEWDVARQVWQPPPPWDWNRRRASGLPDPMHGTAPLRRLPHRPMITWTTPTGHTYASPPPPVLGHGSTPAPDSPTAAALRLLRGLDRMAQPQQPPPAEPEEPDPDLTDPGPAVMDVAPNAPPDQAYLDHLAWLDELEREHDIAVLP